VLVVVGVVGSGRGATLALPCSPCPPLLFVLATFICATLPCPPPLFALAGDMAVSTRDPPCEQWLASVGAGAGLSFSGGDMVTWWAVVVACSFVLPSPPLALPCPGCHSAMGLVTCPFAGDVGGGWWWCGGGGGGDGGVAAVVVTWRGCSGVASAVHPSFVVAPCR
jgi:hypothetical protein